DSDRAPTLLLLDEAGVRQHEGALQDDDRRVDLLLLRADERTKLRPGHGPRREHGLGDVELERRQLRLAEVVGATAPTGERVQRRDEPRGDERRPAAEVLADAGEPLRGELVLPRPAAVHLGRE